MSWWGIILQPLLSSVWSCGRFSWSAHTHTKHTVCTKHSHTWTFQHPPHTPSLPPFWCPTHRHITADKQLWFCEYTTYVLWIHKNITGCSKSTCQNFMFSRRRRNRWQIANAWLLLSPQTPQWWLRTASHSLRNAQSHSRVMFTGISLVLKSHKSTVCPLKL